MKYNISIAIDGRIDVEVNANSFEEAKAKAETAFMFADLSTMEIVDSNPVNAYCFDNGKEMDFDY